MTKTDSKTPNPQPVPPPVDDELAQAGNEPEQAPELTGTVTPNSSSRPSIKNTVA